jgi:hypothetical protein
MPTIEKEIMYIKAEGAYNTDPVIAATDAQIVFSPDYKENSTLYRRGIQHVVQDPLRVGVVGKRQPTISFQQELRGNSAPLAAGVKPLCHDLWQACGFVGTYGAPKWSYVWAPAAAKSVWIQLDRDGLLYTIGGCRGNLSIDLTPGERIMQSYSFQGKYHDPADVASTAPTFTDTPPLFCEGIALQPFGDAPAAGEFGRVTKATLDMRAEVYRHPDVNGTDGDAEVFILGHGTPEDRGATLVLEVSQPAGAAAARWWDRWIARTISAACTMWMGSDTIAPKQTCDWTLGRLVVDAIEDITIGSLFGHRVTCTVMATAAATTDDGIFVEWEDHA